MEDGKSAQLLEEVSSIQSSHKTTPSISTSEDSEFFARHKDAIITKNEKQSEMKIDP